MFLSQQDVRTERSALKREEKRVVKRLVELDAAEKLLPFVNKRVRIKINKGGTERETTLLGIGRAGDVKAYSSVVDPDSLVLKTDYEDWGDLWSPMLDRVAYVEIIALPRVELFPDPEEEEGNDR